MKQAHIKVPLKAAIVMSASLLTQHRTVSSATHPQPHYVSTFSSSFRFPDPCHIYAAADIDNHFACVSSINVISLKAELVSFCLHQTKLRHRYTFTATAFFTYETRMIISSLIIKY
jgi:hypothetical protein